LVPIRAGDGFPRIAEGSHNAGQGEIASFTDDSMKDIPQEEGLVVIFDGKMLRQDPPVRVDMGGDAIMMRYE